MHTSLSDSTVRSITLSHNELTREIALLTLGNLLSMQQLFRIFFGQSIVSTINYIAPPFYPATGIVNAWGLHVIAEPELIKIPFLSSAKSYQTALQTQAHMIGLNWLEYGITPIWWNEFWISKGLTKFYEYYIPASNIVSMMTFKIRLENDII